MLEIKIKIISDRHFLSPPPASFCILYSEGEEWKTAQQSWTTRLWRKETWSPMSNLGVRWLFRNFINGVINLWCITSLPGSNRLWTVKILLRKPFSERIDISLSLEEIPPLPPGLELSLNNSLPKTVEIHLILSLWMSQHLSKNQKMWYNQLKEENFSLYWMNSLRPCLLPREKLSYYTYRKVYHMPRSPRKRVKTHKPCAKPARELCAKAGATTKQPSRKKPNYRKIVDELVSEFSEELCHGKVPEIRSYLNRLRAPHQVKKDLHELLLFTKLAFLAYHPELEKKSKESISQIETKLRGLLSK